MKKILLFGLTVLLAFPSCKKNEQEQNDEPLPPVSTLINPSDANAVSAVLVIPGSTHVAGDMPQASTNTDAPDLVMVDSTVAYSAVSIIF